MLALLWAQSGQSLRVAGEGKPARGTWDSSSTVMDPDNRKSCQFSPDCSLDKASTSSKGFISHSRTLLRARRPVELLVSSLWRKVWGGGAFKRRDAQLSTVALLSQLQIFLMGRVLLLPSMALALQGPSEGHETPPEETPEPGCRILDPRAQGEVALGLSFWV